MKLTVIDNQDGSICIEWDENCLEAIELGVNNWTVEQWIAALRRGMELELAK